MFSIMIKKNFNGYSSEAIESRVGGIFSLENDGVFTYEHQVSFSHLFYYSIVVIAISGLLTIIPNALAPKRLSIVKNQAYECGFDPFFLGESIIEIHFIVVALLFVIFDLEIVFLIPFVASVGIYGSVSLLVLYTYLTIISLVFIFEWREGGLSWPVWFTYQNE